MLDAASISITQRERDAARLPRTSRQQNKQMSETEGFILVGGASRRMGRDKAELKLGEIDFVQRIAQSLRAVTNSVRLVGSKVNERRWSIPLVRDRYVGCGALGGLHAALAACQAEWALIVACDLPFVSPPFLRLLAERTAPDHEAVVPLQRDARPQPLCALYRREPCLAAVAELLERGERRVHALLANLQRVRTVTWEEYAALPSSEWLLFNVNSPGDYARACALLASGRFDVARSPTAEHTRARFAGGESSAEENADHSSL